MDDHLFDRVWNYGNWGLIPRFQEEYNEHGIMSKCPSYEEVKDFCKILNIIQKWAGFRWSKTPFKPSDFLEKVE